MNNAQQQSLWKTGIIFLLDRGFTNIMGDRLPVPVTILVFRTIE
jgi:hypothetical protein